MKTKYRGFCPWCEKEAEIELITDEPVAFDMDGISVTVPNRYRVCTECKGDFWTGADTGEEHDPTVLARAEYKRITGKEWKGTARNKSNQQP